MKLKRRRNKRHHSHGGHALHKNQPALMTLTERTTRFEVVSQKLMFNRQPMPLTTNIAESSNIRQQKNSSSNISLHNLTVALNLTIQEELIIIFPAKKLLCKIILSKKRELPTC